MQPRLWNRVRPQSSSIVLVWVGSRTASKTIATLVNEIDGPLNVVMGLGDTTLTVAALRTVGVVRISLGGSIARAALGFVRESARELLERGTLTFADTQISQSELNAVFAKHERSAAITK